MSLLTWISLAFLLVAVLGSGTVLALRVLAAWRTFKAVSSAASDALGAVVQSAEQAETHALGLAGGSDRMAAANAHLQQSLAELGALRNAAGEAQALIAGIRGSAPRK
ncbi:MAG: hypothetical protein H0X39_20655 [Actinobacteria bacterium]|nr:hypothetical protein [Actinomycetota bacterium]